LDHATEESEASYVQLQQNRLRTLFMESVDTCISLEGARASFLAAAANLPLITPVALAPAGVGPAVELLFGNLLRDRASLFLQLTPGTLPSDPMNIFTGVLPSQATSTIPSGRALFEYSPSSIPLSTRLPFVRTDTIQGSSSGAFVTTRFEPNRAAGGSGFPIPAFALQTRTRLSVPTGTEGRYRFVLPQMISPGFVAGNTSGWVPLGDDLLTLLDACFDELPISVDVHNIRPLTMFVGSQYSGVAGGFTNNSLFSPPFNEMPRLWEASREANDFCWSGGSGFSPPPPGLPHKVLFNVPLQCPPLLKFLGAARRNSTYFNASSPLRFTIQQWASIFNVTAENPSGVLPESSRTALQRATLAQMWNGDLSDRIQLFSNLMFKRAGPRFLHDPLAYYAQCAPAACTYTSVLPRTPESIILEGIQIWGGTTSFVIQALAVLAFWCSVLRWRAARGGAEKESVSVGATNPILNNNLTKKETGGWGELEMQPVAQ
jgi:hypothetical protein